MKPTTESHLPARDFDPTYEELRQMPPHDVRQAIRRNRYVGQTAGIGLGYLQGNLAILPADYALDFFRFCQRNPKPCPMVGVSDTGDPMMATLGADIDIRTDIPLYNVYRNGELERQVPDIVDLWRDDYVAFVLGCSFTFEEALMNEGVSLRHIEQGKTVPMFRTNIKTVPAGPFSGEMVVSMRPLTRPDIIKASEITSRFPFAHGTPVHFGDPSAIGIESIDRPDWGETIDIMDDEVPVFWACGVTPQVTIRAARPPICITHAPGRMLITDIKAGAL